MSPVLPRGLSGFLVDLRPAKSHESFTGDPAPNHPYPTYLPRFFFRASTPSTLLSFKYY